MFVVVKIRITKIREMRFYLTLVSSDLRLLKNERWIFSKVVKISDFPMLSGWFQKYKSALSKSDSSWDNSYYVRLVIVSLAVNIDQLQSLVSGNNFFCWMYNDFYSNFLLYDAIDFVKMSKSIVESCVDKSFRIDWALLKDVRVLYYACWWRYERVFYELIKRLY